MMPFVTKNGAGNIVGVFAIRQYEGQEWAEVADLFSPPAPISVTPWKILKALNQSGLRSAVEEAVAVADQDTRDGWERATEFVENDPLVISLCAAIGKTDADRHALFQLAETL